MYIHKKTNDCGCFLNSDINYYHLLKTVQSIRIQNNILLTEIETYKIIIII